MLAIIGHQDPLKYIGVCVYFLCQHHAIFYKGLDQPQVLVSEGSPRPIPNKYKAIPAACCFCLLKTYYDGKKETQIGWLGRSGRHFNSDIARETLRPETRH